MRFTENFKRKELETLRGGGRGRGESGGVVGGGVGEEGGRFRLWINRLSPENEVCNTFREQFVAV